MKPHQKKYYGALTAIMLLIVATLFVLQKYGSEDIVGLAAGADEMETAEDILQNGGTVEITIDTTAWTVLYNKDKQNYVLQKPGTTSGAIISYSKNSYSDIIQQIATFEAGKQINEMSLVVSTKEKVVFSQEAEVSNTEQNTIYNVLGMTTDTVINQYNQQYHQQAYQTAEQERKKEIRATEPPEEEITVEEVTSEEIVVETTEQEEIIVSYKDANGNEYLWSAVTYDGVTYTLYEQDGTILSEYLVEQKGSMLQDLQNMLQYENAESVSFEEIKEGKSIATITSSAEKIGDDLGTVLGKAEEAAKVAAKTEEQKKAEAAKAGEKKKEEEKAAGTKPAESVGTYSEKDKTFTITKGKNTYELQMVTVAGKPYGKYTTKTGTFYIDNEGNLYLLNNDGELVERGTSRLVTGEALTEFKKVLSDKDKTKTFPEDTVTKEGREAKAAAERQQEIAKLAAEYGVSPTALTTEEKNINDYLQKNKQTKNWKYDAATEHYTGGTSGIKYDGDNMGITVKEVKDGKEQTDTVYKKREGGKTSYYTLDKDGNEVIVKETDALKKQFRDAEKEEDRIESDVRNNIRSGEIENKITINGKEITLKTSIAEAHYLQKQYEQQKAQVKGLLTGYLNKWLDKQFGGWSRGVPAGICAQVFGLEYYKEAGWNRVPMNASSYELQSRLLANSKTAIIEGEKEEITNSLFRYAYTLRLLANQSLEWQTYLYNSCSQETSEDVFYDYGALGAGEFYSFHYAGAAEQDMIFDCAQEDCLFDQACVEFTDGSETVCVSLVHGAGFETPNAGSDFDCAVS